MDYGEINTTDLLLPTHNNLSLLINCSSLEVNSSIFTEACPDPAGIAILNFLKLLKRFR
jgi:hypothetical protein